MKPTALRREADWPSSAVDSARCVSQNVLLRRHCGSGLIQIVFLDQMRCSSGSSEATYRPTFDEVVMESVNVVSVPDGNPVHVGIEALYGRISKLPMEEVRNCCIV
jgi:hypothetical protein